MWFFILFTVVHVYLVFYHDYVEGRENIIDGRWMEVIEEVFS
jgi:Ni/Fe-hydrogenase 1 B-type cytochrome subunit